MKKVGIIFGGKSTEHEVSIVSATSVIKSLDKSKYEIIPIYISKDNNWYFYNKDLKDIDILPIGKLPQELDKIDDIVEIIKNLDIVFPVLHGIGGEDGSLQGMLELYEIPYVGCGILASSVGMDKAYTKAIFDKAKLLQAKYIYIKKRKEKYFLVEEDFEEKEISLEGLSDTIEKRITFPMFVKPSKSGSSVGIRKANNKSELIDAIKYAAEYDNKILVEEAIIGREVECAVLEKDEVIASGVGEIIPAEEFYSFDAKYKNAESVTVIPADLPQEMAREIQKQAIKAFKAIDGKGLSRVDFFVEKGTNKIYINEINTMPGFTGISMYPKLWEEAGLPYSNLLDILIG